MKQTFENFRKDIFQIISEKLKQSEIQTRSFDGLVNIEYIHQQGFSNKIAVLSLEQSKNSNNFNKTLQDFTFGLNFFITGANENENLTTIIQKGQEAIYCLEKNYKIMNLIGSNLTGPNFLNERIVNWAFAFEIANAEIAIFGEQPLNKLEEINLNQQKIKLQ